MSRHNAGKASKSAPENTPLPADIFAAGPLPEGAYPIEVMPHGLLRVSRGNAIGFSFIVRVAEGPHKGHEQCVEMLLNDPSRKWDRRIYRDLALLRRWLDGLGASGPVADPPAVIKELITRGRRHTVIATFAHDEWKRSLDVYIDEIQVQPLGEEAKP